MLESVLRQSVTALRFILISNPAADAQLVIVSVDGSSGRIMKR